MEQAQKKNYWWFPGVFLDKEKIFKRWKFYWKTWNLLPIFPGGFQVEILMRWVQNLIFLGPALMNDLGNQLKAAFACKKIVMISHQSLKKGHLEGKNIPPRQILLYVESMPFHFRKNFQSKIYHGDHQCHNHHWLFEIGLKIRKLQFWGTKNFTVFPKKWWKIRY